MSEIHEVIDRLVSTGVLTQEQRTILLHEIDTPKPPVVIASGRDRLIEVGAYLGAGLIAAALVTIVAQNWEGMSREIHILITTASSATALVAAGTVLFASERRADGGRIASFARRRLFAALSLVGAVFAGITMGLVVDSNQWSGFAGAITALMVMTGAHLLASNAATEVAVFVCSFLAINMLGDALRPAPPDVFDDRTYAPTVDYVIPWILAAFGFAWATLMPRRSEHPTGTTVLGCFAMLVGAFDLAMSPPTRLPGLVLAGLVAGVAFWRFSAVQLWPWLVLALATLTAFMYQLVGGEENQALAFLVAGVVLLAGSGLGLRMRRKPHADLPGSSAGPPRAEMLPDEYPRDRQHTT